MRAVRVGKGFVYKNISHSREFGGKPRVVLLLARVKAQVFVHLKRHFRERAGPRLYRSKLQRVNYLAVRASQVREQYNLGGAVFVQEFERGERSADAQVALHRSVFERHVKV